MSLTSDHEELEKVLKAVASDEASLAVCFTDDDIREGNEGSGPLRGAIQPLDPALKSQLDYSAGRGILWAVGETIRVHFSEPKSDVQVGPTVLKIAKEWEEHANIKFEISDQASSHIRVSFVIGAGSRSAVGIMATDRSRWGQPTMNLDILGKDTKPEVARRNILHEFGHALGLMHEHQRSDARVKYDEKKVLEWYGKYSDWSENKIRYNVLLRENPTESSPFDPSSIMLYAVNASLTTDGIGYERPLVLSAMDKKFIGEMYPF